MKKILVLTILFFLFFLSFVFYLNLPPANEGESLHFTVEKGWGLNSIARELKKRGLIKSENFFKFMAYFYGDKHKLKAGEYELFKSWTTYNIYKTLSVGKVKLISLTILEGWTARKIALKLYNLNIISSVNEFLNLINDENFIRSQNLPYSSLEGFLFPETYYFVKDMKLSDVVMHMVNTFFQKLKDINIDYEVMDSKEFYNKLILASIVEREYRVEEEAKIISSVFYNRMQINMALQSCATIEYIITEELKKPHPKRIYFKDLEISSDYNTYTKRGLPPTPISNPGIVALEAAFSPEKTNYIYFVVKDPVKGTHKFSSHYDEHLQGSRDYVLNFLPKG